MDAPGQSPFEPRLVRLRKRRARAGGGGAFLHASAAEDLAERLEAVQRRFPRALALGNPEPMRAAIAARPALAARIDALIGADVAGGEVNLDPEALPFADESFDLIVSPLLLHAVNDLPGLFIQIRQALRPDGLMLASLLGGATLNELRVSLLEAEVEMTGGAGPRVAPFADLQDVANLLQRAGFALPAADRDIVTVRYAEPMRLLADLRAMGETAALREHPSRALSRRILARAFDLYRARFADADGRVRATFEILTATGWAPHESQQQPLKPGSAKARLANALKAVEQSAGEAAAPKKD
jgi:SAM-dependent methyltransferase